MWAYILKTTLTLSFTFDIFLLHKKILQDVFDCHFTFYCVTNTLGFPDRMFTNIIQCVDRVYLLFKGKPVVLPQQSPVQYIAVCLANITLHTICQPFIKPRVWLHNYYLRLIRTAKMFKNIKLYHVIPLGKFAVNRGFFLSQK